eukprot:SAG31_NODE_4714_length_3012_cov_26.602815_1_plen_175_part_00
MVVSNTSPTLNVEVIGSANFEAVGKTVVLATTAEGTASLGLAPAVAEDFKGEAGSTLLLHGDCAAAPGATRVLLCGLGPASEMDAAKLTAAAAAAVKVLKAGKLESASVLLSGVEDATAMSSFALGAVLADYTFDIYITDTARQFHITTLTIVSDTPGLTDAVTEAVVIAKGQC